MESHNSNNNNINNQSPVSDSSDNNNINNQTLVDDNGQTNNNGVPAVTGVMAWDLCPANVNNISILTDEDVVMEDVEERYTQDQNNNRKRRGADDMAKIIKVAKKRSHNDEIVAVLEQRGPDESLLVTRRWYTIFMPDGTRTVVRLVPTITTKELTRRMVEYFGDMYGVAARMPGATEELKLDWSMEVLDKLKVYTVVVMK